MARVIWTEPAIRDLEGIRSYIGQFNPLAAQRMAVRLLKAGDGLADQPGQGRPIQGNRRELVVIRPYIIRYRADGDLVVIMRIRHGARRP